MSVVEKAGANVLKASFDKKGKKKNKEKSKDLRDNIEMTPARNAPEALDLDYARLDRMGLYTPNDRSSQLALELRAVKRRLLRRIGYLRSSGERQAYRTPGKQRNLILVTSTRAGEGKTFTASFDPGMRVRMDQSDFEEVMGNLLDNALKWAASEVRLKADLTKDGQIMITIADDGPGIPKEEIAKATQSGQRLDTSKPGTGLGLAIAHDLIHAYGGKILLSKDETLGGLAVHLRLPVAASKRPD